MRVMTFNLRADNVLDTRNRWKQREQIVYDMIKAYNCDMIGLQEVTNLMSEDLRKNIIPYHHVGMGRTKNFFVEKNTVLIRKRYEILETKTFWLSKSPNKVGSGLWHSLFPRICTRVTFKINGKDKVCMYNTHLDCLSPVARRYGLSVILNDMKKYQEKEKLPCILTGDFNASPNGKLIKQFKKEVFELNGMRAVQDIKPDLYKQATMGSFKDKETGLHIDYIFVSEEFEIIDAEVIKYNQKGKYPSDHYPIMAEIRLK